MRTRPPGRVTVRSIDTATHPWPQPAAFPRGCSARAHQVTGDADGAGPAAVVRAKKASPARKPLLLAPIRSCGKRRRLLHRVSPVRTEPEAPRLAGSRWPRGAACVPHAARPPRGGRSFSKALTIVRSQSCSRLAIARCADPIRWKTGTVPLADIPSKGPTAMNQLGSPACPN